MKKKEKMHSYKENYYIEHAILACSGLHSDSGLLALSRNIRYGWK
jgi:hypothetical protein